MCPSYVEINTKELQMHIRSHNNILKITTTTRFPITTCINYTTKTNYKIPYNSILHPSNYKNKGVSTPVVQIDKF